jgi:amino acid transporter
MGYAQELFRAMGGFSNFAISFTIISILSGCVTLFYLVPTTVGFGAASIGWPLITIFVVIVALGMAELASAYPTAGGLYYWSSKLGFRGRGGPAWGWYTGWFNLIGQVAITAGIAYGAAVTLDQLLHAWIPNVIPGVPGFADPATQWTTLLIYAIILAAVAMLNIFGVRIVAFLNDVSVGWHIVGVVLIVVGVVSATIIGFQFNPGAGGVAPAVQVTGSAVHGLNSGSTLFSVNSVFNATGFASALGCSDVGGGVRCCWLCSADGPVSGCSRPGSGRRLCQWGAVHPGKPYRLFTGNPFIRRDICCAVFLQYVLGHVELTYDLCFLS